MISMRRLQGSDSRFLVADRVDDVLPRFAGLPPLPRLGASAAAFAVLERDDRVFVSSSSTSLSSFVIWASSSCRSESSCLRERAAELLRRVCTGWGSSVVSSASLRLESSSSEGEMIGEEGGVARSFAGLKALCWQSSMKSLSCGSSNCSTLDKKSSSAKSWEASEGGSRTEGGLPGCRDRLDRRGSRACALYPRAQPRGRARSS